MTTFIAHRARAAACAAALLLASACAGESPAGTDTTGGTPRPPGRPTLAQTYRATGHAAAGDVFVHLFEWRWDDVATECETVLGPAGYRAVQISPPQEHVELAAAPWWQRYQAVTYRLDRSRSGTRAELASMIARCRAAGVDVYVDAIVNHTSAGSGIGSAGTRYTKFHYPGWWTQADFHEPCAVRDYQSAANVQDCELLGLSDLHTGLPAVRQRIADYLIELSRMGVAGFRIDAAKHVQPVELDSIVGIVHRTLVAEGLPRPYWFGEVIDYGGEGVTARDYFGLGYASGGAADITEFRVTGVGDKFMGNGGQRLADLDPNGPAGARFSESAWNIMPSDKAVVFLENHDTQRSGAPAAISYRAGQTLRLAYVWLLAQPYGYPSVMSSYAFERGTQDGRDAGPPSTGTATNPVSCAARLETAGIGSWVCEHRDPLVRTMVGFRRAVAGSDVNRWWSGAPDAIAFSRGDRGFVAINRQAGDVSATIPTGLAAGTYCEVLGGGKAGGACAGASVTVGADGRVQLTLPASSAVVLLANARL